MPKRINTSNNIKHIWEPENEGDAVRGFYLDRIVFQNAKYQKPTYLIGFPSGACVCVNAHTLVQDAMDDLEPSSNVFVNITFQGEAESKNGRTYKRYKVDAWQLDDSEVEEFTSKVDIGYQDDSDSGANYSASEDEDDDLPF